MATILAPIVGLLFAQLLALVAAAGYMRRVVKDHDERLREHDQRIRELELCTACGRHSL